MDLMERVKAECYRSKNCVVCKLHNSENHCCMLLSSPFIWDIEAIRKALGETSDKASDKDDLSGSAKRKMTFEGLVRYAKEELGINIILKDGEPQSFEEIFGYTTEIEVPKKWKKEKLEEMPFGEPYDMVHDVMKKQNEIIDCLEKIKERVK